MEKDAQHKIRNGSASIRGLIGQIRLAVSIVNRESEHHESVKLIRHWLQEVEVQCGRIESALEVAVGLKEEHMIRVKVIRLEQTEQGALGALIVDGEYFGSTLEPDEGDPQKHQIPHGTYKCRRFHGQRFKDTFEVLVEGHTAVLFHPGNTEKDTLMCVLMGKYPGWLTGQRAVLNSGATFNRFMKHFEGTDEFEASFVDFYGGERDGMV